MWRIVLLAVVTACGRYGFVDGASCDDAHATGDGGASDAASAGLLFDLTFDVDVTTDATGEHDATCTSCPTAVTGRVGAGAASFDGMACLDIADAFELRPTAFTVALWTDVTPQLATAEQLITRPLDGATTVNNTFELFYTMTMDAYLTGAGGASASAARSAGWHHLAVVFDGGSLQAFYDATATGSPQPAGAAVYSSADEWHVGCDVDTGTIDHFYVGLLDDVRLYDRALSASEIAALAAM